MIYLGLGSNLGNRRENLRIALRKLIFGPIQLKKYRVSHVFESEALVPNGAPNDWHLPFYNIVICGETQQSPEMVFTECKKIERNLGRKNRERWSPRPIDIDILGYAEQFCEFSVDGQSVTIPHKEVLNRSFTLIPLSEIAPNWVAPIPGNTKSIKEQLQNLTPKLSPVEKKPYSILPIGLMGIVNITPDSFSDGDEAYHPEDAISRIQQLVNNGADIIDLGAESTRPGAKTLTPAEEWNRLEPILTHLKENRLDRHIRISVDSRKPETIKKAFETGTIHWINDVTGLDEERMIDTARTSNADVVFMHHLGVPPEINKTLRRGDDPIDQVLRWTTAKIERFESLGLNKSRLILDPGIGFGKTAEQSLEILLRAGELKSLGLRILVGHSRKSFLSLFTQASFNERDPETVCLSTHLLKCGIDFIRVHNIKLHQQHLNLAGASFL